MDKKRISKKKMQENRMRQYISIINSPEYREQLTEMAKRIVKLSETAPNEATIESNFDCELFAFFRDKFHTLGFEYNPTKEKAVATTRNILKGRADTAIASLIIEFKQPKTLSNDQQKEKAINQISDYMISINSDTSENIFGFVTDGVNGCFLQCNTGKIEKENFYQIDFVTLNRIIQCIVQVKLIALNAKNLVDGICNSPDNDGIGFQLAKTLFSIISTNIHPKTKMLFDEWKQLFNLAHDDISKQQAIIDRRNALENCFNCTFKDRDEEYTALYCLQTSYAIIVKAIAYKILSQVRYNKSLINFYDSMDLDSESMRKQLIDLEDGAIFIQYGITNLLEGDFFSWYTNSEQWNDALASDISSLYELLSRYNDKPIINSLVKSQDFFKELYQAMIPTAVRHSLGEYYTKKWLATNVVETAIQDLSPNWKALDPCCGSGTFLTVLIDKVLKSTNSTNNKDILHEILSRVKGIDLNPIATLTARVNYFINISQFIDDDAQLEIPVYLGDASYVPNPITYNNIECLQYTISTILKPIDILIPLSMVSDTSLFSHKMNEVETQIKLLNVENIFSIFCSLTNSNDLIEPIKEKLLKLATQLVDLEKRKWNGIWARIITNFLTTANLGKFDLLVGNPPWVDWKSLPSNYRDRIKSLCISRKLFSGDVVTGGINLNICALITNVIAQNWLSDDGVIALLMPEPLVFQQSYEGFRNLYLDDDVRLYFYRFVNWNKAGHPFKGVSQKFLTYYIRRDRVDYDAGVPVLDYIKKPKLSIDDMEIIDIDESFDITQRLLATCHPEKNFFTYVSDSTTASYYRKMAGLSPYIGREGIEFYPQELLVFKLSNMPSNGNLTALDNMQNKKSKYKVPKRTVLLETAFLHPMVKGKNITPFHVELSDFIVPFPYDASNPQVPIVLEELSKQAPKLARYYMDNKDLLVSQTGYADRIIGKKDAEFYALARVGAYSYAKYYVAFRDNTKWAAAVVTEVDTPWGGLKRPVFQNHAVSICERDDDTFISFDEAHYICGILNTNIVAQYMETSSDARSFPIRPRIKIPRFNGSNATHMQISTLSKQAHQNYDDKQFIDSIRKQLDTLYLSIL